MENDNNKLSKSISESIKCKEDLLESNSINDDINQQQAQLSTQHETIIVSTTAEDNINKTSSSSTLLSSPLPNGERIVIVPSNIAPSLQLLPPSVERKPTEGAGIVIKKDYLPSPAKIIKLEKTREDVTRVLSYDTEINNSANINAGETDSCIESIKQIIKLEKTETIKLKMEPTDEAILRKSIVESPSGNTLLNNISENKENAINKTELKNKSKDKAETVQSNCAKPEIILNNESDSSIIERKLHEKVSSREISHHHINKTSSSSSTKSSSRRSSSSSNRECSRCYRHSKIKRTNIGIQCRPFSNPFKQMTPSSTPQKLSQSLTCDMVDSLYSDLKYGKFFHVEVHTNGGASVVHMYQNELNSLSESEMEELTEEFFRVIFCEDENGWAHHVMGIVHDAAAYIPDLLEHMADNYSTLTVKAGVLGRNSDIETSTMAQYYEQVEKHYSHGTFRYGPLHQISLVGKVHEEVGGYFPDLLGRLEQSPFLKQV